MAARPPAARPYVDPAGFSAAGVDTAALLLPWASVELVPFVCSVDAEVDDDCGAGVEAPDVPFTFGVGAGLCDCCWP